MTRRMTGRTAVAVALFAVAAVTAFAVGTGRAQPGDKSKGEKSAGKAVQPVAPLPVTPLDPNPVAEALQDELDLLQAQAKLKQLAVTTSATRQKTEEDTLKRLEAVSDSVAQSELARQRTAVANAKAEAETKAAELAAHELLVKAAKRKLDYAVAHPPKPAGPSATDAALAKLVQLAAERNAAEKEWMAKESARQTDEAKRQKQLWEDERARREKEDKAREEELKEARARAVAAEERAKEEMKRRLDAEAERARQEKVAMLKRLPNEIADTELRLRAVELKQQQLKLELDAAARDIEHHKATKAQLEELRAALEKELKAKNDR